MTEDNIEMNYVTKTLSVHIRNTEEHNMYWRSVAAGCLIRDSVHGIDEAMLRLADRLKKEIGDPELEFDALSLLYGNLYKDLLDHVLTTIQWEKMAEFLIESVLNT